MLDFLNKSRKEYLPKLDYSTLSALEIVINEVERIVNSQSTFIEQLGEQRKEIDTKIKEKEKVQKTLIKEGESLEKGWDSQLNELKKARTNYVKLGKEAQAMAENLEKKKQDPKTKPEVVSQLSSKTMSAAEKRDNADNQYKNVLDTTNQKMETYYSREQPDFLNKYQNFEEDRINFMKEQFEKFSSNIKNTNLSTIFDDACQKISSAANNIDVDNDIILWAQSNGKHLGIPEPIIYCTYDIEGGYAPDLQVGGRKPDSGSSGSSKPPSRRPEAPIPTQSSSPPGRKTNKTAHTFDPSKYSIPERDRNDPKRLASAVQKALKMVDDDEKQARKEIEASEKLLNFYAKDPAGRAEVEEEIRSLRNNLDQLAAIRENLESANSDDRVNLDDSAGEPATAIYDYTAANETELSFKEGDVLTIRQKDESGWWFATLNGKEGFVPANYMQV